MIADLDPREFKRDVEAIRLSHCWDYWQRAHYWRMKNRADKQTADFHRRLAAETDPIKRCIMLGQNLSPWGKPMPIYDWLS